MRKDPTHEQKIDTMRAHTDAVLTLVGTTGLRGLRKHFAAYCDYLPQSDELRSALLKSVEGDEVFEALSAYQNIITDGEAA